MLYTDNIGLKKPAYSDPADIADINENSDIIDREFGNRYLKSETYSVEQANKAIAQAIEAFPNGLVYCGAVNYYKDLPTANNKEGDTYSVKYQGETGTTADGNEYAWGKYDGTLQWIKLGVNAYTKDEIDAQREAIESDILSTEKEIARVETSLQNQINGIVLAASGSGDITAEVIQARVNENGRIFPTLKSRIDASDIVASESINKIKEKFVKNEIIVFSAYDTPTNPSASNTFMGFATPYEYHGVITSVVVNGGYRAGEILLEILAENFTTVIASTTKTVTTHNGTERFSFDKEIYLDGIYYFSVRAIDAARFAIENATTPNSKRSTATPNKYMLSSAQGTWTPNTTGYDIDIKLYNVDYEMPSQRLKNVIYVGSTNDCQFDNVQSAINSITDDSETNPYIIYVKTGTYEPFTMVYTDNTRTTRYGRARWISVIGLGCMNDVIFFDNRGNYKFSPCEIYTNGVIKNITFIDKTDSENHTQENGRTFAYAVHSDFGTCKVRFENCYMYSNAGPAVGVGTWEDETIEFYNCRFESDCDGTFGDVGQGAFFCHTATDGNDRKNQALRIHHCIAIAPLQANGARLAVIPGYDGGTYSYELQNFGSFGMNGARVSLTAPDNDLLSPYCFNNTPTNLNYLQNE